LSDKKIAFLGWAFKKDTNDTRESAAIYVADILLEDNADIHVYDPKVSPDRMYADIDYLGTRSSEQNRKLLHVDNNPYDVLKDAFAIAVITEWDEFKDYDWKKIYANMMKPAYIFDGRNILDHDKLKEIGFIVKAIGK